MNPRIFVLAFGIAIGYVLGTRDGRERYDAMKARVTKIWEDPRVAKARKDVEAYAREQAPIIRERAETVARDTAARTSAVAKDVAVNTAAVAKDVAAKTTATAKDVAAKTTATAKDVAAKVTDAAGDARVQATKVAGDVREQATKVAGDIRGRGEAAVTAVGNVRDDALDALDDDDDKPASN
ncbi:MAG: protoporphyrinogen oxidase [Rhodoglobus sp.]